MSAQQAFFVEEEEREGQKSLSAMLDGVAPVVVDASRSKAAESQPAPRLGGFGDPSLAAQVVIRCFCAQDVSQSTERRREALFFLGASEKKRKARVR